MLLINWFFFITNTDQYVVNKTCMFPNKKMRLTRTHSLGVKCEKINGDGQWVPTNTKNSTEISLSELNDFGDTVDSRCLELG